MRKEFIYLSKRDIKLIRLSHFLLSNLLSLLEIAHKRKDYSETRGLSLI